MILIPFIFNCVYSTGNNFSAGEIQGQQNIIFGRTVLRSLCSSPPQIKITFSTAPSTLRASPDPIKSSSAIPASDQSFMFVCGCGMEGGGSGQFA